MNICEICGRTSDEKKVCYRGNFNMILCDKHWQQIRTYGKFFDNNKRTINDLNEIICYNDYAEILLYDIYGNETGRTKIDLDDVDKIKDYKWCKEGVNKNKIYITNGNKKVNKLHRYIMGCNDDMQVDHINGNTFDNRKCNLRVTDLNSNAKNLLINNNNTSGFSGVTFNKRSGTYVCILIFNNLKYNVKEFKTLGEAVYIRFLFDTIMKNDFRNKENDDKINSIISNININKKSELEKYLRHKIALGGVLYKNKKVGDTDE